MEILGMTRPEVMSCLQVLEQEGMIECDAELDHRFDICKPEVREDDLKRFVEFKVALEVGALLKLIQRIETEDSALSSQTSAKHSQE